MDVFVGVPVYRSGPFLPEMLRSLCDQSYTDFRAAISIDGEDSDALAACGVVAQDARFEVVVQPERLGWPGNFNWLLRRCDREFFTYWQQDDVASTGYLEALRATMLAHPRVAVAYTDVQYFGSEVRRDTAASFDGSPLARVLQLLESLSYVPLRGLMRASMLPDDGIQRTSDRSAQQESVFHARLAARGAFRRVEGPLYFKRAHPGAESRAAFGLPAEQRRNEAARMGAGVLGVALEHAPPEAHGQLLALVLDRLCVIRPGRGFFYEVPAELAAVREMAAIVAGHAGIEMADGRWAAHDATGLERPVHPRVVGALAAERVRRRAVLASTPRIDTRLAWGWCEPEAGGIWTAGRTAALDLAPGEFGPVTLHGRVFAPLGPVAVGCSADPYDRTTTRFDGTSPVDLCVPTFSARRLHLWLPDALSPHEAGVSTDPRVIGFHLEAIESDGRVARIGGSFEGDASGVPRSGDGPR